MGSAVTSAYGKAKTAIVAPFGGSGSENEDPISLGSKANVGPELHVMNGSLHESQGNYAKALDSYSKALEIEPKNPPALLSTARLYDRQQDKDKAIEFFQRAAVVAPNNASIFAELGGLQARNGNLATAKIELQKAVNLDPKSTTYRSSLAGVLLDSGNADSALSELNQVNSPAMANYQMAYLHFARKNVPATQKYLGAALEIDPNLKPARDLMASMGGAQNLSQMAQQGQQSFQQAQGIYQQVGAMGSNIQGLMNTAHNASPSPPNMGPPNMGPPNMGPPNMNSPNMQSSGATPASAMLPLQGNGLPSSFPSNQNASAPSASIRR